jgi:hypothetical protein
VSPDQHARTMLPIPDRPSFGLTTYDAKDPDTSYPPIEPLVPPEGAPNVLIILLDDVGFGASSPSAVRFTGKINWVQIDLGKDDHAYFIDPEERLRVAMSRQ